MDAGFWNYLREDITFSLLEECPLKMDLSDIPLQAECSADPDYLNSVSLILGRIVNACFGGSIGEEEWFRLLQTLRSWRETLPNRLEPFSTAAHGPNSMFPSVWMLQDSHGAF